MVKVNKQKNSDIENFIYHQHGERLAILNTENIKICRCTTKLEAIKNAISLRFLPAHVCRKFEFLVFQGSVATRHYERSVI